MNKKFSTLLTGLALVASAVTATAADIKLKVGPNDGLYQIAVGDDPATATEVLSLDADGNLTTVDPTTVNPEDLSATLWCVNVTTYSDGQAPKFDFTNKKHSRVLAISVDGNAPKETDLDVTVSQEGDISGWAFSTTYKDGVEDGKQLFSYFTDDSVAALNVASNTVYAQKWRANEVDGNTSVFSLRIPERMTLNAAALNTLLGMNSTGTSFKLNFKEKAATGNVFANELVARDTTNNYVVVTNKASGNYLRVDSAFNNTMGVGFVQLTDTTKAATYTAEAAAANAETGHYAFQFEYLPSSDSVIITVKNARLNVNKETPWSSTYLTTNRDSLHVYVQDLVTSSVLTVGKDSSEIKLGFGTCGDPAVTTKTTIPSDLYVIKSTDGKYLAAPIHGDSTVQWVTLEKNVNVWEMPSFQWVVEKNIASSNTSQIKITNREFGTEVKQFTNVQLDKETATVLADDKSISKGVKADGFVAATAAVKADSLLGYKYLNSEELMVTRYKFRYLHEFSDDYYAGVNSEENDSILYVGGKSPFSLKVKDPMYQYGYTSSAVAGLKPLYRQSYTLKIRNAKLIFGATADSVVLDKEGRFAVSDKVTPLTFLLKANNEKAIDEKDIPFYAFIKLGADTTKVGTDDNNLWMKNQIMTESRTSAFSVEVDDSPLYRRFNTTKEGEVATDDPDTVKFFRVNNTADMLFEDAGSVYSKDKGINFLGVNNNIQFPNAQRAIYVDTAYVNRGTGYIKPQYMLAVGVNIIPGTEAIPCPLEHNHGFDKDGNALDKWTCSHATPGTSGYVRGRYLINTVDSAKVNGNYQGAVRDADYIWNNQVRLAFVNAIHKEDTLYILKGDTATWADPIDLSKIGTKIRLDNNNHKNVVFSFRLLEEGNDDFLIESAETDGAMIAPMQGGWIKIQNGVPVVSYAAFSDAANEAEIFNVEKTAEKPVANESIDASAISVIAKEGAVVVKGAAGKKVTIANVLGQTVANTVITSDEAAIAAPAGVVVVSVEGEAAVKAIVK